MRIYLVSCVATKLRQPAEAKDLYISPWFRKARALAEHDGDAWFILSAKYGIIEPDAPIFPYSTTLNAMPAPARRRWAKEVLADLLPCLELGDEVVILAGVRYREHLLLPLASAGIEVEVPMQHMGIGRQLQWMGQQLERR